MRMDGRILAVGAAFLSVTGLFAEPLEVGTSLQVLWDDHVVDVARSTAEKRLHHPQNAGVAFVFDAPWEGQTISYPHVVETELDGDRRYRLYYLVHDCPPASPGSRRLCVLESGDGIAWKRPELGFVEFRGSRKNNILADEKTLGGDLDNFYVFRDTNPSCPPDERYKAIFNFEFTIGPDGSVRSSGCSRNGLECAVSANGLTFVRRAYLFRDGLFDSLNTAFWDPVSQTYRLYFRGGHENRTDRNGNWWIRDIRYSTSRDFRTWTKPEVIRIEPYADGTPKTDYPLYTGCVQPYFRSPDVCVGLPTRYVERRAWTPNYDRLPSPAARRARMDTSRSGGSARAGLAVTDCVFMMTRDGLNFSREEEAFIRPGPEREDNWIYGDCYPSVGFVLTPDADGDDEVLSFYLPDRRTPFGKPNRLLRRTIRQDGFVSRHADLREKVLVTKELVFSGDRLRINFSTSARGYVFVTVRDRDGNAFVSDELFGDKVDRWVDFESEGPFSAFAGKPVTLEFRLCDADIWAFGFGGKTFEEAPEKRWHDWMLPQRPTFRDAPFEESKAKGMRDILVSGFGPGGNAAEFFCYYALPDGPIPEGGFPGVLLVHGGGGTAYPNYVERWRKLGFAVLAPDWRNSYPAASAHPDCLEREMMPPTVSRPLPGGVRNDIVANVKNLYTASSLLRSMPEVNAAKTVYVGLSWGSWYGAILASLDDRFNGYVEIYCGDKNPARGTLVDGRFLHAAKKPMYWSVWTNDPNARPEHQQSGFEACARFDGCTIVPTYTHSHIGFKFGSVERMALHYATGATALPRLDGIVLTGSRASARILSKGLSLGKPLLWYTQDGPNVPLEKRKWESVPAEVVGESVVSDVPSGAKAFFLSLYEAEEGPYRDLCGSSGYVFR